ncbi:MAG: hypothetical protein UT06_C0037G0017 [Candidatus Woesebacteria bacterium GW2011_GWA1_38_8]|uniref:Uncharacterized protein n=1 Tax=Candidatus Woesebacteria bacterium GW2011_GWA1_38_8 TaxID=1618547 RepID=A0A0G0P0E0_9BACT|nr:MAG: hypothetical protein UT06_C0037G0017 [Candidatus Woesebacteria bacterium GW2011_GWA1_38_8]
MSFHLQVLSPLKKIFDGDVLSEKLRSKKAAAEATYIRSGKDFFLLTIMMPLFL